MARIAFAINHDQDLARDHVQDLDQGTDTKGVAGDTPVLVLEVLATSADARQNILVVAAEVVVEEIMMMMKDTGVTVDLQCHPENDTLVIGRIQSLIVVLVCLD